MVGHVVILPVTGINTVYLEKAPKLYLPAAIGNFKTVNSLSLEVVLVLIEKVIIDDANLS